VAEGMGMDRRIGRSFLDSGIGYGGSCFPKDVDAFIRLSEKSGYDFRVLKEIRRANEEQQKYFVRIIEDKMWNLKDKTIGVWGLAFKPHTDDIRNAASLVVISMLQQEGAKIRAYDPKATEHARKLLKGVTICSDPYETAEDADALLLLTEWPEFKEVNFKQIHDAMRQAMVFDGRNFLDGQQLKELGFEYFGIGRGSI